ncbi:Auxin-responsive protein [Quillaja saponaria]|uniref:Auxin-induced protein n=1 Tax=Quillaja saponaria TaxID=32244 RepID=A0AAD7LTS0_QUISA|nr:Auxin-responsive protein [Quillaja saponaria]
MAAKEGLGLEITELRLGLPGWDQPRYYVVDKNEKKRVFSEICGGNGNSSTNGDRKMQTKNQVVGWPPVCLSRRKKSFNETFIKMYVKVSMDGAPFLRKIDLGMHKGFSDLAMALEKLFGISEALKDADSGQHIPIYEDKDGDWMLLGDVPWEMFIESCKRLRIMKRSDAKRFGGLQPKVLLKGFLKEDFDE